MGAMNANDDARNTGTRNPVTTWNTSVPAPAVNSATLGSRPVRSGTSTSAPNATNSIWAPMSTVRGVRAGDADEVTSPPGVERSNGA
jgi:hypothetical protein